MGFLRAQPDSLVSESTLSSFTAVDAEIIPVAGGCSGISKVKGDEGAGGMVTGSRGDGRSGSGGGLPTRKDVVFDWPHA